MMDIITTILLVILTILAFINTILSIKDYLYWRKKQQCKHHH